MRSGSLVVHLDIREIEANHVHGMAGVSGVREEADPFSRPDGAESLGNDVGVVE
jgi:hypothetical protein